MSRTETTWLPWTEVRRYAAAFFAEGARGGVGFPASRDVLISSGLLGLFPGLGEGLELAAAGAEPEEPGSDQPGLEFKVRPLPARQLHEWILLLLRNVPAAVEFLVRQGCRGHRGLRDARGAELGYRFETMADGRVRLDNETFELYAVTGLVWILSTAILHCSCSALQIKDVHHG